MVPTDYVLQDDLDLILPGDLLWDDSADASGMLFCLTDALFYV